MVSQIGKTEWVCLSSDVKSALGIWGNGHKMTEMDTGKVFQFNSETKAWIDTSITKRLASISVTHSGTDYEGHGLDTSHFTVTATYSDSTTDTVTDNLDYSLPDNVFKAGSNTVTVGYTENGIRKTATVTVTATALAWAASNPITITTAPTKTEYIAGEFFDPTGMVVTGKLNDNSTFIIPNDAITYTPALTMALTTETAVKLEYTYREVKKSKNQAITVTAAE